MRIFSRFILLFFASVLLFSAPAPAYAQGNAWKRFSGACRKLLPSPKKVPSRQEVLKPENIEKILARRARLSRKQAWQKMDKDARRLLIPVQSPIQNNFFWVGENLSELYADNPILKNAPVSVKRSYFQAANNRLVPQVLNQRIKNLWWLKQHRAVLETAVRPLAPTPQNLAAQIPVDTQYWFIGEEHGQPKVRQTIADVLSAFMAQHPDRQIVFFTEFLAQGANAKDAVAYANLGVYKGHATVWNVVHKAGIELVGLEPRLVRGNQHLQTRFDAVPDGIASENSIWISLEGMRLRNKAWVDLMQKYRQKYPKALFVVHCGEAHSDYLEPFSLGLSFPKEKTFVSAFYTSTAGNQFERFMPNPFSKIPAIQWSEHRYALATGYDLRVLVKQ